MESAGQLMHRCHHLKAGIFGDLQNSKPTRAAQQHGPFPRQARATILCKSNKANQPRASLERKSEDFRQKHFCTTTPLVIICLGRYSRGSEKQAHGARQRCPGCILVQGMQENNNAVELVDLKQPGLQENFDSSLIVAQIGRQVLSAILALALGFQAHPSIAQGLPCEDTSSYYRQLDGLKGQALKSKLHEIIKDAKSFSYVQVWAALQILDAADAANPAASPDVIDIYSKRTLPKSAQGLPEGWNREHLWPRSYGLPEGKPQFTDLHNLRPADTNVNSARGNKPFGECDRGTDASCLVPANREAGTDTATNRDIWTPPGEVRGDIARALLYMAVRYEGKEAGTKDLELSDQPSVELARMGRLSTLLKWHAADPPSPAERLRNDRVCSLYQHNRNPFVDHPELVAAIWGAGEARDAPPNNNSASETRPDPLPRIRSPASVPPTQSPQGGATEDRRRTARVNEFHYNNTGKDEDEFVEIAIGRDVDPASVVVHLYNGANGSVYRTLVVKNEALFQKGGQTAEGATLYVCMLPEGLQNGPADGIAVTVENRVVDFISYEGGLTAASGPAAGLSSVAIEVKESERTPKGSSIGLVERLWRIFTKATPGLQNR